MDEVWKFAVWFSSALVLTVFMFSLIQNEFARAFIIAVVVGALGGKLGERK